MPIDEHILRDETILASSKAHLGGILYATNKRVIKYRESLFGEKLDSIYYSHIVGASYEQRSYIWLVALGIVMVILGVYLANSFALVLLGVLGLILIIVGIFHRPNWYQIKVAGLGSESMQQWRTAGAGVDAKTFARFINDQISKREIQPPLPPQAAIREKEVITKEIVMVKCEYCGALMPQTATFCPNCGAKRR